MRISVLSDIHGNCVALDAVLADIDANDQEGVDEYWILGDLAAAGAQPLEVMERLDDLKNARFVRGNSERYLTTGARPLVTPVEELTDLSLLPAYVGVLESFAWTAGAMAAGGHLPFMLDLPLEQRLTLPDESRVLLVHASPGRDDGAGFVPRYSDEEMGARLIGCEADLVCVGHTHWPQSFHLNGVHVVNPGSVGNPLIPSLRATYAVLEADAGMGTGWSTGRWTMTGGWLSRRHGRCNIRRRSLSAAFCGGNGYASGVSRRFCDERAA